MAYVPPKNYWIIPGVLHEQIIIQTVCAAYHQEPKDVLGSCRKRELLEPRQIIAALAKELLTKSASVKDRTFSTGYTLAEIGMLCNPPQDHATVLHSCRTVETLCVTDKFFRQRFNEIRSKLLWMKVYSVIKNPPNAKNVEKVGTVGNNSMDLIVKKQ